MNSIRRLKDDENGGERLNNTGGQQMHLKRWIVKEELFQLHPKYKLKQYLGAGAYGIVCSASDASKGGRLVAIKKCKSVFGSKTMAKRMLRELRILRYLDHPNVIKIIHIEQIYDRSAFNELYFSLECMETDLAQIIRSSQPLNDDHVQYFSYQLFAALEYIHGSKVLHRDIKPRNILVNSNCELKLADFGLARVFNDVNSRRTVVMTEYVTTRWYRAPEVLVGWHTYSCAVDVWAAGTVIAELVKRQPLFPGKDTIDQLELITHCLGKPPDHFINRCKKDEVRQYLRYLEPPDEITPIPALFPRASPLLIDILSHLLQYDPALRLTAINARRHPYFRKFFNDSPVITPCVLPPIEFFFESTVPSIDQLRDELLLEVDHYNPLVLRSYESIIAEEANVHAMSTDRSIVSSSPPAKKHRNNRQIESNSATEMCCRSPCKKVISETNGHKEENNSMPQNDFSKPQLQDNRAIARSHKFSIFTMCSRDDGSLSDDMLPINNKARSTKRDPTQEPCTSCMIS